VKAQLAFDPADYEYGPATAAIRSILLEWTQIDWFEAAAEPDERGAGLFREHQRLAHAQRPDLFPEIVDLRIVSGDRTEFAEWCTRVRSPAAGWDWKMTVLKDLSCDHSRACEWTPELQMRGRPAGEPRPGDLFVKLAEDQVLWNHFLPELPGLRWGSQDAFSDGAAFYRSYAHGDALQCMQWQLAEGSPELAANPFLPLLRCYRAGAYPFSLGRESVVLFRFRGAAA
jgi:hypothetical protein